MKSENKRKKNARQAKDDNLVQRAPEISKKYILFHNKNKDFQRKFYSILQQLTICLTSPLTDNGVHTQQNDAHNITKNNFTTHEILKKHLHLKYLANCDTLHKPSSRTSS